MLRSNHRFTRSLWSMFAVLAVSVVARAQYDDCRDATLSSFAVHGTLVAATIDGTSSCQLVPHPDRWWSYRPATSGVLTLSACSSVAPVAADLILSVHSGCPGTIQNELACNDDSPSSPCGQPHAPSVTLPVTAGAVYYVRVSTADGSIGAIYLTANGPDAIAPSNGTWQTACAVSPGLIHGNNLNAPAVPSKYGWFSYTPATSGMAVAETCGLGFLNTVLELRENGVFVGTYDDNCGIDESSVQWMAQAGVTYQIGHGFFANAEDFFPLRVTGPPAAQESCATAQTIGDGVRWLSFENAAASGSSSCDAGGIPAVYYRYVASGSGVLTVSTLGSDDERFPDAGEDTLLSLHSGCPATPANTIACNDTAPANGLDTGALVDAAVRTTVTAGQSILIRVARNGGGTPDSNFPVHLSVSFSPVDFSVCDGDGSGAPCPCANVGANGHGCAASHASVGALLAFSGVADVGHDTVQLVGTSLPASGTGLYIQGTIAAAAGNGTAFGDGLRCAAGTVRRLGVRASTGGASSFGFDDAAHVSIAGAVPPAGGMRIYQLWYRDAAPYCTSALFNLSNGLSITWGP
jgi:hypothetical protein